MKRMAVAFSMVALLFGSLRPCSVGAEPVAEAGHQQSSKSGTKPTGAKADEIDFRPYMATMDKMIKANYHPAEKYRTSKVVLKFQVSKVGQVCQLGIAKSSGSIDADKAAIAAVKKTGTLPPLPPGGPEHIDVQYTLNYHVNPGHSQRAISEEQSANKH